MYYGEKELQLLSSQIQERPYRSLSNLTISDLDIPGQINRRGGVAGLFSEKLVLFEQLPRMRDLADQGKKELDAGATSMVQAQGKWSDQFMVHYFALKVRYRRYGTYRTVREGPAAITNLMA